MSDCIFCKIVGGQIPKYIVYEDDYALAFLDINPCTKGHTVVVPKKHIKNMEEITAEDWDRVTVAVRAAAARVQKVLRPEGMNVGLNNNPAAGQAVPHLHWHIIPRYPGDGGGSLHSIFRQPCDGDIEAVAALFV